MKPENSSDDSAAIPEIPMTELQKLQNLYARNLFVQAYRQSAAYWSPSTKVNSLSIDELTLGGRLAARFGGATVNLHGDRDFL